MSISEQVKELRELANSYYGEIKNHVSTIEKAADTIESLSAKLQAANMERSAKCYIRNGEVCYLIRDMMLELESFNGYEELIKRAENCLKDMKRPERYCYGNKNSDDVERILNALDDIWTYGEEPTEEIRMAVGDAIDIIQNMERSAEDCGGWIPCKERLPEKEAKEYIKNELDGIGYLYPLLLTYRSPNTEKVHVVRFYWNVYDKEFVNNGEKTCDMDRCIAWKPLPERYHEP